MAEGAPFNIRIPVSGQGGDISTNVVTLKAGSTRSSEITVTRTPGSQTSTQLVAGPFPVPPKDVAGVQLGSADPLVLFAAASNRAPVPEREFPWLRLRADDKPTTMTLSPYFRDPDGDALEYGAVSLGRDIVSVSVSGDQLELSPLAGGTATVTVTATDPGGLSSESPLRIVTRGRYPGGGSFDIDLVLISSVADTVATAFDHAVEYWSAVLASTELSDVPVGTDFELGCRDISTDHRVDTVDDLLIVASATDFDGPGGVLAGAAVCAVRDESRIPFMGVMFFDTADLDRLQDSGDMEEVILHEIGHVLGFGTIWSDLGMLVNPSLPSNQGTDTHFSGAGAIEAFDEAGGRDYTEGNKVPVENLAGPGSEDAHWRESVLGNEIMSPRQTVGVGDPLSSITIMSLADLWYIVDVTLAEPFMLIGALAADLAEPAPKIEYGDDVVRGPIVVVDQDGEIVTVIPG